MLTLSLSEFEWARGIDELRIALRNSMVIHRGRVHAQDVKTRPEFATYELSNVIVEYVAPTMMQRTQAILAPNLPWAEDHFQERVSGIPHNPAPSEQWWPYRQNGNAVHKNSSEVFSHTYPERMWPRFANVGNKRPNGRQVYVPHNGIRYEYGDLSDLVNLLARDPFTRQAFLPIWFPEDTGAVEHQRVPCSLGYHFIRRGRSLDCQYFMRSCDFFRHYTDDAYMAVRLLQWVCERLQERDIVSTPEDGGYYPFVGKLTMFISNLHAFKGDQARLDGLV